MCSSCRISFAAFKRPLTSRSLHPFRDVSSPRAVCPVSVGTQTTPNGRTSGVELVGTLPSKPLLVLLVRWPSMLVLPPRRFPATDAARIRRCFRRIACPSFTVFCLFWAGGPVSVEGALSACIPLSGTWHDPGGVDATTIPPQS
jgi:hypothetical protein